jgi:hypothetical protein
MKAKLVESIVQENFDKRDKKKQITFPLRHFFPLKVVPLIEVLLYHP